MNTPAVHPISADDFEDWCGLYRGYAEFYHQPMNERILQTVWQWLQDGRLHGVIARRADRPAGFAHWELILRPLRGVPLCYLHDLFVYREQRGHGCGRQLLAQAGAAAQAAGCHDMRWLTQKHNHTARHLYDKTARPAGDWVLYQQTFETP